MDNLLASSPSFFICVYLNSNAYFVLVQTLITTFDQNLFYFDKHLEKFFEKANTRLGNEDQKLVLEYFF